MKQLYAPAFALALMTMPAQADDPNLPGVLRFYVVYSVLAFCLLGWAILVVLTARGRVEGAAHTLGQRPLASFIMGMLCFGWLLLALGLAQPLGDLGGLLVAFTMVVLSLCALLGLPAIFMGLGRRASLSLGVASLALREVVLGALVLFAAGGLPFLGWLLLGGVTLWAAGGAVLSLLAGQPKPPQD